MFETLSALPIAERMGREALRLPADEGLPAPAIWLDRIVRDRHAPGRVWDAPWTPIIDTLRLKFSLAGSARTRIGREDFVHEAGTAILVRPGEVTWSAVPAGGPPWDFAYVSLRGAEAERLGCALFSRTGRRVPLGAASETVDRFADLFRKMSSGGFESPFSESLAAYGLLTALWNDATVPAVSAWRRRLDAALRFNAANFDRPVSVAELAAAAGLSESHLHRLFLQETGVSPHRHLVATRLERARELLRTSPLSVKEVCARSGFRDLPNFCRLFKRAYGVSPGASRPR